MDVSLPISALTRAVDFILLQVDQKLPDCYHRMADDVHAAFEARLKTKIGPVEGRVFQTATVAEALIEAGAATPLPVDGAIRLLSDELLALREREGWRYFPTFRFMPCDLDDFGIVLRVIRHFDPSAARDIYRETLPLIMKTQHPDGGLYTWIAEPQLIEAVSQMYGGGLDPEVVANFLLAVPADELNEGDLARALQFVVDQQKSDGFWESRWYASPMYSTSLCSRLLKCQRLGSRHELALQEALIERVRHYEPTGGVLDAVWLVDTCADHGCPIDTERIVQCILDSQSADGSWPPEPFISWAVPFKPDIRRQWGSRTVTTALVTRCLADTLRRMTASAAQLTIPARERKEV
jgi:hypothetical protein